MGVCASKPATKSEGQHHKPAAALTAPPASPVQARRTTVEQKEAVAGATEQAKDAVQLAGQQVQSQVKELELLQTEIDRLKQAPVSVSEDAQNQSRIRQLEQDVLRVRQEINVALEIAEHEVQEAVLTAQASLRGNEGNQYVDSQAVHGNSAMASTDVYPPGPLAGTHGDPNSGAGFSQSPHGPLADETISLSSSPHSVGASRAALAGSSFADSEASADRHPKLDLHSSAHDHSSWGGTGVGSAYEAGGGGYRRGVQVSSTPILGGKGTYTVQPLSYGSAHTQQQQQHMPAAVAATNQGQGQHSPARSASQLRQGYAPAAAPSEGSQGQYLPAGGAPYGQHQGGQMQPAMATSDMTQRQASGMTQRPADGSQNQEQYMPAMPASGMSHAWASPAAAAWYSSFDSTESPPGSRHMEDSSAIGVVRSPAGNDALQAGRAEANSGLQHERSLRSFYSSGRDSPDFRSESTSPEHQGHLQASGLVSQNNGHGYSQNGMRESKDDGQAEDLVSDVHLRAQSASQAAVAAGLDQQHKAHHAAIAYKEPAPTRPLQPPGLGPVPPSAPVFRPDASPASLDFPQMTQVTNLQGTQMALSGPSGVGGEIDWGKVQEIQKQAMITAQESMEQSRRGLMEVREAIQRRAQMQ